MNEQTEQPAAATATCVALWRSVRPRQWTKNLFVFAAVLFSRNLLEPLMLARTAGAFAVFCALSGAAYILNDLADLAHDREHPVKRARPLASGALGLRQAGAAVALLTAAALIAAFHLSAGLLAVGAAYLVLQGAYSLWLKNVVILDVFAIALGFVLRVVAGAVVIGVVVSPWLLICTILLALFLGLCKRRHELLMLEGGAPNHRSVLGHYSTYLLDQMISVIAAASVIAYALYTMAEQTVERFGTANLIFTVPFVLYGILRYLYLVHQRASGGDPEETLLSDKPLMADVLLWVAAVALIVYLKPGIGP